MRAILLGNAGAGKSSLARRLAAEGALPILSLDDIAWNPGPERKPLAESVAALVEFVRVHDEWVIEGSYADLVEAALPFGSELRFLNPGVEICIEHCERRPWEPDKYATDEAQAAMLADLIEWVRAYEVREDEYGLRQHRAVFDRYQGPKREYRLVGEYAEAVADVHAGGAAGTAADFVD